MVEAGIVYHQIAKYIPARHLNDQKKKEDNQPLAFTLEHIFAAMVVLCFGLLVAGAAFTVEVKKRRMAI